MGPRQSWLRDPRAWGFVAAVLVVGTIDLFLPPAIVVQAFVAIPIVASAVLGRPFFTGGVGVLGLAALILSASISGYSSAATVREVLIVGLAVVAAVALAEVFRRRRLYRVLAENASDIVLAVDPDHCTTWVSSSVSRVLGWTPNELLGRDVADLVHPDDQSAIRAAEARMASGQPVGQPGGGFVVRLRDRGGAYHWSAWTFRPLGSIRTRRNGFVVAVSIVDDLMDARDQIRRHDQWLQATIRSLIDPLVVMLPRPGRAGEVEDFTVVEVNDATCVDLGLSRAALSGRRLSEAAPWVAAAGLMGSCAEVLASGQPFVAEGVEVEHSGRRRILDVRVVGVDDSLILSWRDVTEHHESARMLAESEERYRLLAHNSSDVVFLSRGGVLEWVSPSLARALGWSTHHWIGQHFPDLVHPDDRGPLQAAHDRIRSDHSEVAVVRVRDSEEMDHWITLHIGPFVAASGEFDGIVGSFHVSDDEVAARKELERRAGTDDLTGALIRDEALTRIEQRRRQRREPVALLFIDVDEFKAVNDQRGHAAGDVVLTEIVERMRATVRAEDPIARLGGDEFLVALPGLSDIERALGIAEQIRASVGEPMAWQGIEVRATVSIGVAILAPDDSLDAVIARADRAMYEAKRGGRNQVVRA